MTPSSEKPTPNLIGINRLLKICREIELVNALIYEALADQHRENGTIARIWRQAAREETGHASQIDLAMRIKRGSFTGAKIEQSEAEEALAVAKGVLARVKEQPLKIEHALREAVRMEEHFVRFHAHCACELAEGATRKLFEALRAGDEAHVAALEHALEVVTQLGIGR